MPLLPVNSKPLSLLFAISNFYNKPSKELLENALEEVFTKALSDLKSTEFSIIELSDGLTTIFTGNAKDMLKHEKHNVLVVKKTDLQQHITSIAFEKKFTFFSLKNLSNVEILRFAVVRVTGSLELPQVCAFFLNKYKNIDGVVALGIVKKGGTNHNHYVASEAMRGLTDVSLKYLVPLTTGIITAETDEHIIDRVSKNGQNIGKEAVSTCFQIINVKKRMDIFF